MSVTGSPCRSARLCEFTHQLFITPRGWLLEHDFINILDESLDTSAATHFSNSVTFSGPISVSNICVEHKWTIPIISR